MQPGVKQHQDRLYPESGGRTRGDPGEDALDFAPGTRVPPALQPRTLHGDGDGPG